MIPLLCVIAYIEGKGEVVSARTVMVISFCRKRKKNCNSVLKRRSEGYE
jgi:hypothetical protein